MTLVITAALKKRTACVYHIVSSLLAAASIWCGVFAFSYYRSYNIYGYDMDTCSSAQIVKLVAATGVFFLIAGIFDLISSGVFFLST